MLKSASGVSIGVGVVAHLSTTSTEKKRRKNKSAMLSRGGRRSVRLASALGRRCSGGVGIGGGDSSQAALASSSSSSSSSSSFLGREGRGARSTLRAVNATTRCFGCSFGAARESSVELHRNSFSKVPTEGRGRKTMFATRLAALSTSAPPSSTPVSEEQSSKSSSSSSAATAAATKTKLY